MQCSEEKIVTVVARTMMMEDACTTFKVNLPQPSDEPSLHTGDSQL